jgi:hypothetical protein
MTPPNFRDDEFAHEFARQLAADIGRLILAVASDDTRRLVDEMNLLLCTIREHLAAMSERPSESDKALVRAVALTSR